MSTITSNCLSLADPSPRRADPEASGALAGLRRHLLAQLASASSRRPLHPSQDAVTALELALRQQPRGFDRHS